MDSDWVWMMRINDLLAIRGVHRVQGDGISPSGVKLSVLGCRLGGIDGGRLRSMSDDEFIEEKDRLMAASKQAWGEVGEALVRIGEDGLRRLIDGAKRWIESGA